MKVLVTGGAGYIGSFMTRILLEKGHKVVVLDSLERGHREAVDPNAEFVKGNILDTNLIDELLTSHNFDGVLHFAGLISMEESVSSPDLYFKVNAQGSTNLVEAMLKHKIDRMIFSSTAGVYGDPIEIPIPEDHPRNPKNPYGESKLKVEKMLEEYQKTSGLNFVSLRYFNAAGASLDGLMGEDHSPETHIIPLALKAALNNDNFYLYGVDYKTSDGTCIRDYIHVLDLVEAHVLALDFLEREKGGFFYNVGVGEGFSNKQVLEMVKKISGIEFKIVEKDRRPGDAEVLIADSSKINKELGFSPKYSNLETIVKTAWDWHKNSKV